jgi:hypothetical protein
MIVGLGVVLIAVLAESSGVDVVQSVLASMSAARTPWTSCQLMSAVRGIQVGRVESAVLAPRVLAAWEAHRPRPPIEIDELAAVFEAKRDSIDAVEVTYRVTLVRHGVDTGMRSIVWWVYWAQDGYAIHRSVASTRARLSDPRGDASAMAWRTDGKRLWFSKAGSTLREVDPAGLSMVGMEDSWLGAGGCIGRRSDGTARAAEHDLAAMLAASADGTAIIESALTPVGGTPTVSLRMGWTSPCWIYLDPARGFAPLRIDRWLDDDDSIVLARSEMEAFRSVAGGVWLPDRIRLRQYRMPTGTAQNAEAATEAPPYLDLSVEVVSASLNSPIEWGRVVPRWDREPE